MLPENCLTVNANIHSFKNFPGPVSKGSRIQILDILRGVAVLGILAININDIALPWQADHNPTLFSNGTALDYWSLFLTNLLFTGKMRGLFSLLFGAGMFLLLSRLEKRMPGVEPAEFFVRRMIWLSLFGLIHAYIFLYPGDILFTYALVGLFLIPFRKAKARSLLMYAGGVLLLLTVGIYLNSFAIQDTYDTYVEVVAKEKTGHALTADEIEAKAEWEEELSDKTPDPAVLQETIEERQGDYLELFGDLAGDSFHVQSTGMLMFNFWDVILMMLIGLALMKMGFFEYRFSLRTYAVVLIISYTISFPIEIYYYGFQINHYMDIVQLDFNNIWFEPGRIAGTIGHLCLLMLLAKLPILPWLGKAFAQVGRMALSNYMIQTAICIYLFYGFGFGLHGQLLQIELYYVIVGIWLFQIAFSNVWLHYFRFGPLEWVWRSLCYWKVQPLSRKKPPTKPPLNAPKTDYPNVAFLQDATAALQLNQKEKYQKAFVYDQEVVNRDW